MKHLKNILVTGAAGYIGSHTLVELLNKEEYHIIAVDNYTNSSPENYRAVEKITGSRIYQHVIDLTCYEQVKTMASQYQYIDAIIHFAAYKSVPDSVYDPLAYYDNNINSLLTLLKLAGEYKIPHFIFSSSCAVYGDTEQSCIDEQMSPGIATSPYAFTKQVCEQILLDFSKANAWFHYHALRYFNPAGYHPSAILGEHPGQPPQSLVPVVCNAAAQNKPFTVFGNDYPTADGTCIRDYVHVCDIANAHVLSLEKLLSGNSPDDIFNLGSGKGYSVKEVISAFEKINQVKVPYDTGSQRKGDIMSIYASNSKATEKLGWSVQFSLEDIVSTAWAYYSKNLPQVKHSSLVSTGTAA